MSSFKNWRNENNSKADEVVEEIKVNGKNLVNEIERLLREGEVRQIRIKQNGKVLLDIPIIWAVLGTIVAPPLAAVGAIAAVVSECTIEVIRKADRRPPIESAERRKKADSSDDDLSYR